MHRITLQVLGRFGVAINGRPLDGLRSDSVRCLLAFLAAESDRAHTRGELAALLWPDEPAATARHNLRQTLYQLKHIAHEAQAPDLLEVTRDSVRWPDGPHVHSDVADFLAHLARNDLAAAVELYRGEFLAGLSVPDGRFAEWLEHRRTSLHRRACDAVSRLAAAALNNGDAALAREYARQHLTLDALAETAHAHLLQALIAAGDRPAALAHYRIFERQLATELGIAPSEAVRALLPELGAASTAASTAAAAPPRARKQPGDEPRAMRHDLLEMPPTHEVFGRDGDLAQLRQTLTTGDGRLIAITGLGGIGKTTLASLLTQQAAPEFDVVGWRSLANTPPLTQVLRDWLTLIQPEAPAAAADDADTLLRELLMLLGRQRCLLVLDNVESIFDDAQHQGRYRPGYENYGVFFQRIAESAHRSHVLLTSRELPSEIVRAQAGGAPVRVLALKGLDAQAVGQLLSACQLEAGPATSRGMTEAYSGNPLAIKLASHAVQTLFDGNAQAFLGDASRPAMLDDVRRLIDSQYDRLTALERRAFFWLALARTPRSLDEIWEDMLRAVSKRELADALLALARRSLADNNGTQFYLQNVVLDYAADRFVDMAVAATQGDGASAHAALHAHAWIKARTREHVRDSQIRNVLRPIAERLLAPLGRAGLSMLVRKRLDMLRQPNAPPGAATGYAAGNLINLLSCAGLDLRGLDFSGLTVRQAHVPEVTLAQANFANAELAQCVFRQDFTVIKSLAFDSDGQRLAMGTSHGEVRMWNLRSDQLDWRAAVHEAFIWSLAVSADGKTVVSGGDNGTLCVLDASTGQLLHRMTSDRSDITGVALSPDGQHMYSVCAGGVLQAVTMPGAGASDTTPDLRLLWQTTVARRCDGLALSPDGRTLACSSNDGAVYLLDASSGALSGALHGHAARSKGLDFSPDGQLLVTASDDYTVRIWDVASGRVLRVLTGHTAWVWGVRFSPDGRYIASSGDDQTIRIWRTSSGACEHVIRGHRHWVRPIAFHPSGAARARAADDQTVRLWDVATGRPDWMQQGYTNWIRALSFSPADGALTVATADHAARVWHAESGTLLHTLNGHSNVVTSAAYSADGRVLVTGSVDASARIWQMTPGSPATVRVLRGHEAQVYAVAVSADGALIATGSADHCVVLWHGPSGREVARLRHAGKVYALAFDASGDSLYAGTSSAQVCVWDTRTHQCRSEWQAHSNSVYALSIDAVNGRLATGSADDSIRLWTLNGNRLLSTLRGHSSTVFALAFSPDGRTLASGSFDRSVRLWHTTPGELAGAIGVLDQDAGFLRSVAFSADGRLLASGGADEWVRVWDMSTHTLLRKFKSDPPYAGMNIAGTTGLSPAQREVLFALGAVERA